MSHNQTSRTVYSRPKNLIVSLTLYKRTLSLDAMHEVGWLD